ncbi:hypothetical protein BKA62DRAFT_675493 [Auriculariales sp. MPI-PUGE-AT-0066]|nr:hypothetical protein BKA62DRAFT_675493 [Auriculariales sp. MPI-PUGE-AT-0066]
MRKTSGTSRWQSATASQPIRNYSAQPWQVVTSLASQPKRRSIASGASAQGRGGGDKGTAIYKQPNHRRAVGLYADAQGPGMIRSRWGSRKRGVVTKEKFVERRRRVCWGERDVRDAQGGPAKGCPATRLLAAQCVLGGAPALRVMRGAVLSGWVGGGAT